MTDNREWKPMSELTIAPGQTLYFDVREVTTYRWLPYKSDGRRQMKASGRWQVGNDYGWENCSTPIGEWTPNIPKEVP